MMQTAKPPLAGQTLAIVSRCAWTLYNFRRGLVAESRAAGAEVLTLGAELDGFERKLAMEGVAFEPVPVPMRGLAPLGDTLLFVTFCIRFLRLKPDIVHAFTIKPVIYATLAAALIGVPRRICTITGLGHAFTAGNGPVRWIASFLYRVALARAHIVFFQNADDRDLFVRERLVDVAKTRLVAGSGVDLTRFALTPMPSPRQGPVRFLMLSRLLEDKGVREYVEAAEVMRAAGVAAEFRLIGAADPRNPTHLSAADLERLHASPVHWMDRIDNVEEELRAADVAVLPSYREGTPRSLLEAMATGRMVVTTDAPGCRDLVEEGVNGYLVPIKDAKALAAAMTRCVTHSEDLHRMGIAARAFVEANYDEKAVIECTIQAYRSTLASAK